MFHEDRELITKLKGSNARFTALFDKHNDLDEKIAEIQKGNVYNDAEVEFATCGDFCKFAKFDFKFYSP